ncbi:FAD-binding oxidoreductase [Nitrosomonas sp.]|uniref:FAD-binding oxidoreductase n=1 Tax=Nitrosomonas sp. TaxID=42353 RepID=UPI00260120B5|nr:FAD-binding oxidoreductase [Nitrosomonas sp.]
MKLENAFREWEALLGRSQIFVREAAQLDYGSCTTGINRRLAGALKPLERDLVVPIVKIAANYKIPLYPISTGHNWGYGTSLPAVDNCIILDLSELRQVIDFDTHTGLVTVEPGVTQGQLAEFLHKEGYPFMVPVTGAGPTCSLLGNALERGYGITPYTDHFGAVMALQAVMPDGSVYQSALTGMGGGHLDRAFKWGIGPYLDGLFSQGSVGVVTQMTIALARRPEAIRSFLFGLKCPKQLGDMVMRIHKIIARYPGIVGGINLMNAHRVLAMTTAYPRERVAIGEVISSEILQKLCRENFVLPWTGLGTLYGSKSVVKAAQREIQSLLSPLAARLVFVSEDRIQTLFRIGKLLPGRFRSGLEQKLRMLERSFQLIAGYPNQTALPLCYWLKGELQCEATLNPARDGCGLIWYAPLVPMDQKNVACYIQMVTTVMNKYKLEPLITLTSLSDRCFDSTVPLLFDPDSETARRNAENCYWELLEEGKKQGFLPYRVGIQTMNWLSANNSSCWQMARKIKHSLDPDMIIAPGRYI